MVKKVDIAWAAGIIEGEGTFGIAKDRTKFVTVRMTDEDIILRLQEIFGGNVTGPYSFSSSADHKPLYRWSVSQREKVVEVLEAILPYMGIRRSNKINELLLNNKLFPRGYRVNSAQHGTISMYSNSAKCRCEPCKEAWKTYQTEYKERRLQNV